MKKCSEVITCRVIEINIVHPSQVHLKKCIYFMEEYFELTHLKILMKLYKVIVIACNPFVTCSDSRDLRLV